MQPVPPTRLAGRANRGSPAKTIGTNQPERSARTAQCSFGHCQVVGMPPADRNCCQDDACTGYPVNVPGDEVSVAETAYGHGAADLDIRAARRNHWFTSAPYGQDARRYTISRNRSGNYTELVIVAYSQHRRRRLRIGPSPLPPTVSDALLLSAPKSATQAVSPGG